MTAVADALTLEGKVRGTRGKEIAKKIRRAGEIPAVIYGAEKEPVSLSLNAREFGNLTKKSHGDKVLIPVTLDNGTVEKVFIKSIQRDPVSLSPIHVDLLRVDMTHKITLAVRVVAVGGTPEGVRAGGILEHIQHEVRVHCLPDNVPAHIEVDLSSLQEDHSVHVRELPALAGVEYVDDPAQVVFTIVSKNRAAKDAAAGDVAPAATPAPAPTG
jgi:large subunit ribosomal protein L25